MKENKDAHLKKIFAELNLNNSDRELSKEEQEQWRYATDSDFKFKKDLEYIFNTSNDEETTNGHNNTRLFTK